MRIKLFIGFKKAIILIVLFLISCNKGVKLNLYNTTGVDIDSFSIGNIYLGKLKSRDKNKSLNMDSCQFDGQYLLVKAKGYINGKSIRTDDSSSFCGTMLSIETSGTHHIDIVINKINERIFLSLEKKKFYE